MSEADTMDQLPSKMEPQAQTFTNTSPARPANCCGDTVTARTVPLMLGFGLGITMLGLLIAISKALLIPPDVRYVNLEDLSSSQITLWVMWDTVPYMLMVSSGAAIMLIGIILFSTGIFYHFWRTSKTKLLVIYATVCIISGSFLALAKLVIISPDFDSIDISNVPLAVLMRWTFWTSTPLLFLLCIGVALIMIGAILICICLKITCCKSRKRLHRIGASHEDQTVEITL